MFCPLCKAEYREGFTRCNDCDVALVANLPSSGAGDPANPQSSLDSPELLWDGADDIFCARLTAALADAKIPYREGDTPALLLYPSLQLPLHVWTFTRDHEAAIQVLKSISEADGVSTDSTLEVDEDTEDILREEPPGPDVDDIVEDFYPEDATAEVWRGDSVGTADILRDCLLENGIGCVIDDSSPNEQRLRVRPKDEVRSREIIREVIEGTPSE